MDSLSQTKKTPLTLRARTVVLVSLAAWAVVALAGSASDVCLGDESVHIRTVRLFADHHARVPYDPLFTPLKQTCDGLMAAPLWHGMLAVLWEVTGLRAQVLTQAYHAGYYLLLLLAVYYGVRGVWGASAATWAWLIAATMPVICAYSILLYQDVPGLAVSALGFLLLWRKRFVWAGVVFGAAYLTKLNMLSFAPWAVVFAAYWSEGPWWRRLRSAAAVALPVMAVLAYDMTWRWYAFGRTAGYWSLSTGLVGTRPSEHGGLSAQAYEALKQWPADYTTWKPYPIYRLKALVSHLGFAFLGGMLLGVWRARDALARWLWGCFLLATVSWFLVFIVWADGTGVQVRYTLPMVLVLLVLIGRGLRDWRLGPRGKAVLLAACALQGLAVVGYVAHARQISPDEEQAYAWLRAHAPEGEPVMTPERILAVRTGRPYIWGSLKPPYLLTDMPHPARRDVLRHFGVSHIFIHRSRLYDRAEEGTHYGGYPREFLAIADGAPYLEKVFENPAAVIYRVRPG